MQVGQQWGMMPITREQTAEVLGGALEQPSRRHLTLNGSSGGGSCMNPP